MSREIRINMRFLVPEGDEAHKLLEAHPDADGCIECAIYDECISWLEDLGLKFVDGTCLFPEPGPAREQSDH